MLPKKCPACKNKSLILENDYLVCPKCKIYRKPLNFFQRPLAWATERYWWWRVPILAWFSYMLYVNIKQPWFAEDTRVSNFFSGLDLGIHELGHIIFSPFGDFIHIAGGCLFQCIFPILWLVSLHFKKWYFASAMCWCWLGMNLFDVGAYAADARARLLPLSVGPAGISEQGSDESYDKAHDWYQMLSRTHHLNWDLAIGHIFRVAGTVSFIIGLSIGLLLIAQMLISSLQRLTTPKKA